jgi:hypothetical protein
MAENQTSSKFADLLNDIMTKRWYITALVLGGFLLIIGGIFYAMNYQLVMAGEWKELLLLLLGAFIGSYGKIIDYWFSDQDKDKMLVQKADEEDGTTLSHTNDMKESNKPYAPLMPDAFVKAAERASEMAIVENKQEYELAKDQQEHEQEMEKLEFLHHEHKQCEHVFADVDHDGDYECIHCGKIKDF